MAARHSFTRLSLIGLILALVTTVARADFIDFDDIDSALGSVANQSYAGFSWDSRWALGDTSTAGYGGVTVGGTQYLFNSHLSSNLVIYRDEAFDFLGAYLAAPALRSGSGWVNISAFDTDNNLIGSTGYQALGNNPVWLGAGFNNVSRLVIDPYGGYFALSHFEYRDLTTELSEAGSLILLTVGLGGLWFARRRIRRLSAD